MVHQQNLIGIRREDKNIWERRVPLTPNQIRRLIKEFGIKFVVQSSAIRAYSDEDFRQAGAEVREEISDCPIVLGVKEMPVTFFRPGGTYLYFAHVIKGQRQNMEMLKRLMELECSLIEYEKVTDDQGRRLLFFGRFAGIAGMIDTLAGMGRRLKSLGLETPFVKVKQAHEYVRLKEALAAINSVGEQVRNVGLPLSISPLVIGVTGYGNVARGVKEVLTALGTKEIKPADLPALLESGNRFNVYQVTFREEDMVEPNEAGRQFNLNEYYTQPELYRSSFERHLPHLSVLVNCIYWDNRYPRLVTKDCLRQKFIDNDLRLIMIGDISCDIEGSIEVTLKATNPGAPFFVYHPLTEKVTDGVVGDGIVLMAIDNLPCELAQDASEEFGEALVQFIPAIARTNFQVPLDRLELPPPIRRALILHQGKLTPEYRYLEKFIKERI